MLKFFSVIGSLLGYSFVSALGNDSPFFVNKNINLSQFCKKYRCDVDETNQNNHGYFHFQRNLKIKVCKFSNLTQCNLVNDHIMTGSITYDVNDGSDPYNSFDKNVAYAININLYQNKRIYWSPNQPAIIEILSDFLVAMNVKSASTIIKRQLIYVVGKNAKACLSKYSFYQVKPEKSPIHMKNLIPLDQVSFYGFLKTNK